MTEPIWSTGGAGGERAVTEDLEWAAGALRAAADDVASARAQIARRRAALALDPGVGYAVLDAQLAHAEHGWGARVEGDLDDGARRLAAVAEAYLEAERRARHRIRVLGALGGAGANVIGSAQWGVRAAATAAAVLTPVAALAGLGRFVPAGPPPTTAVLNAETMDRALASPGLDDAVRAFRTALRAAIVLTTGPGLMYLASRWTGRLRAAAVGAAPARSLEDVMALLRQTEVVPGGAVRIERWTDADGATRRLVFIPGTKDWLSLTTNPFDADADLALMAGQMPDAAAFVAAALAADGARPGDPVMLAGHSLGGTVAAALAGNADFRKRFAVQAIITAGAPTGRIALPATVNALHLEGTRDIVPGLDGRPNPDTPRRVTVHHDARDSELPQLEGEGEDIASAHSLDTYGQTARLIDEGVSPSTHEWLRAQAVFLDPQGPVTTTEYRP